MAETRLEKRRRKSREASKRHREKKRDEKLKADARTYELRMAIASSQRRDLSEADIEEGIDWMSALLVPDGPRLGQPFDLEDWQREWIRGAMRPGIQVAGMSIARKNAKTMLNVAMEACFLAGPWNRYGWVGLVCADVGDHAALMMYYLDLLSGLNDLRIFFRKSPRPGRAFGKDRSKVVFLAADKDRTGHGENADIVWLDEAGAFTENQRPLWNALYSSIGSRGGKMMCLGNQREGPMFLELEKRAQQDEMVYWKRYQAPLDCDPMDEEVWGLANPGLGTIKELQYMRGKASDAKISPLNLNYFMSFDLNMDVDPARATICTVNQWKACYDSYAELRGERVALGIDMGGSVSMSAAFAIGLETGIVRMWAAFSSIPDILSRGREDGVNNTYVLMQDRGELSLYPGEVVDAAAFISDVLADLEREGCAVAYLGADRYRKAEFSDALRKAGYRAEVAWRGTGAGAIADGSNDIRAFQRLVFDRKIAVRESLGMINAIMNSHLEEDVGLNPRLAKNKSRGRIDLLQAGVIAAGLHEAATRRGRRESGGFELLRA